jgi:hypothetical protein
MLPIPIGTVVLENIEYVAVQPLQIWSTPVDALLFSTRIELVIATVVSAEMPAMFALLATL